MPKSAAVSSFDFPVKLLKPYSFSYMYVYERHIGRDSAIAEDVKLRTKGENRRNVLCIIAIESMTYVDL